MLSGNAIIKNSEKQLKILAAKKINVHHLTGFLLASGFHLADGCKLQPK
jgi:hypothetical protein